MHPLLQTAVQTFIQSQLHTPATSLAFQSHVFEGVAYQQVLQQLQLKQKCKFKLPLWFEASNILFHEQVNLEQASSSLTAQFKSKLLDGYTSSLVDLTGGFGVDSFYFAQQVAKVHYVEPNADLLDLVQHNHQQLQAHNITHHCGTAEEWLPRLPPAQVYYLDPSRRAGAQRVYDLKDCTPNILELWPQLLNQCQLLMVKLSPMVDVQYLIQNLPHIKAVYIISVQNDCKELLVLAEHQYTQEPIIRAVNLNEEEQELFEGTYSKESSSLLGYGAVQTYIYDPYTSLHKSLLYKSIGTHYNLTGLHPQTHLYTNSDLTMSFAGRIFKVLYTGPVDKKKVSSFLPTKQANIITRNTPFKPDVLQKKLGLKDGGDRYVMAYKNHLQHYELVVAERVK